MKNIILFFLWACMIILPFVSIPASILRIMHYGFDGLAIIAIVIILVSTLAYMMNEASHKLTPDGVVAVRLISAGIAIVLGMTGVFFITPQHTHPYIAISYLLIAIAGLRVHHDGVVGFISILISVIWWPITKLFGYHHRGWSRGNWNEDSWSWLRCLRIWVLRPVNPFAPSNK